MVSSKELDALRSQVVQALPGWTILVIQFNGLIADRLGVTQTDLQCLYALAHCRRSRRAIAPLSRTGLDGFSRRDRPDTSVTKPSASRTWPL
jgi:hypothetical protein